jgi:hypothetical protein
MGASFRSTGQILALAGCDLLTISPDLLQQLQQADGELQPQLHAGMDLGDDTLPASLLDDAIDESRFRFALNEDAMASEKLAEGIRLFAADTEKLAQWLHCRCQSASIERQEKQDHVSGLWRSAVRLFVDQPASADSWPQLRYQAVPGGSPFNVAIGLARLGQRAALFSGMSQDFLGRQLLAVLEQEGVDCRHLQLRAHHPGAGGAGCHRQAAIQLLW